MIYLLAAVGVLLVRPQSLDESLEALRAAYASGRDGEAVLIADRMIAAHPTASGEVFFWRGAALLRLERTDEALTALEVAFRRGYVGPELHLERALALQRSGKEQEAQENLAEARRLVQDDPERLSLLNERWRLRERKSQRFESYLRPSLGYDSNIVGVSDETDLTEEVDRESSFYGAHLLARFRILDEGRHTMALEYRNDSKVYANEPDLSYVDNLLSIVARLPIHGQSDFQMRASYGETLLSDDGHFRTLRSVSPSLLIPIGAGSEVRVWGEWANLDYYAAVPSAQDRDGHAQHVGLDVNMKTASGWSVKPFASFLDYSADGDDFDRTEWSLGIALAVPALEYVHPSIAVGYSRANYSEPNSLVGFAEKRVDRRVFVSLSLTAYALESSLGFAPTIGIRFEDWDSNIDAYDFERWRPHVDFVFLALSF